MKWKFKNIYLIFSILAHGDSVATTAWDFRIGRSTLYGIIPEVCTAIWTVLKSKYLQCPVTKNEWLKIVDDFETL